MRRSCLFRIVGSVLVVVGPGLDERGDLVTTNATANQSRPSIVSAVCRGYPNARGWSGGYPAPQVASIITVFAVRTLPRPETAKYSTSNNSILDLP